MEDFSIFSTLLSSWCNAYSDQTPTSIRRFDHLVDLWLLWDKQTGYELSHCLLNSKDTDWCPTAKLAPRSLSKTKTNKLTRSTEFCIFTNNITICPPHQYADILPWKVDYLGRWHGCKWVIKPFRKPRIWIA